MAVIGNAPFQGLVSGGNILDASIEGVDLSTSAIAARLGYTPVDPGAAAITGGTINGTTIGATTAATGAFTNLSASGTLGVTGVATLASGAVLNTPASVTLTNATGLPVATGVSGLGTGIATALAANVGSAGAPVVNGGVLGTPASGTVTNLTGTASININGTVGATTANTGAFTTLSASGNLSVTGTTTFGGDITSTLGKFYVVNTYGYYFGSSGNLTGFTGSNGTGTISVSTYGTTRATFSTSGVAVTGILSATGNVGVGVDIPDVPLTIKGGTNTAIKLIQDSGSGTTATLYGAANTGVRYGTLALHRSDTSAVTTRITADLTDPSFFSSNVGIGQPSPTARIHAYSTTQPIVAKLDSTQSGGATLGIYGSGTINGYFGTSGHWLGTSATDIAIIAETSKAVTFFTGGSGTERMRIDATGNVGIGTTSPSTYSAKLAVVSTAADTRISVIDDVANGRGGYLRSNYANAVILGTTSGVRDLVLSPDNTEVMRLTTNFRVGINQPVPEEKLDVNGNIYIHTSTGNPYLRIKTDAAGNNPSIRLQANTNYWDIQTTFSNVYDDLMFMYNGANKMSFSTFSGGGLAINSSAGQLGRLTVDTNGHQHVVRGGTLNSGDYYYRFLKLFKLKVSASGGSSTEVKGRLHLSRVNEIGVSMMVDFYATQGYDTQIRAWYKRVSGSGSPTDFRFVTLVDAGSTYLCLEFVSAPGFNSWQFEGSVIDNDGGRGNFDVTVAENLTTKEVGPWTTPISDPSIPLLQDTTYGPKVFGSYNIDYSTGGGTNIAVASTHIFGAPQTSGSYGEALRITSTGKIGINQSAPNALVHIGSETEVNITNQALFVQGTKSQYAGINGLTMGSLFIYDDTAGAAGSGGAISFGANTGSSQRTWIAAIESRRDSATTDASNYAGSLVFYTRPAQSPSEERMRISSAGVVMIKSNTSEGQTLKVGNAGGGDSTIGITAGAASTSSLWFGDTDANVGYILYNHASNYMAFRANGGSESMRISSGGNLGINNNNPSVKLTIGKTTTAYEDIYGITAYANTSDFMAGIGFDQTDDTLIIRNDQSFTSGGIGFRAGGTTNHLFIKTGGNIGIGTNSPNGKLEIAAGADNQHIRIGDNNHDASSSTFRYPALSYYARRDNNRYNGAPLSDYGSTASIVFTDRPGTSGYPNFCRTSDIEFWTATNTGGTALDPRPTKRLSITAEGVVDLAFGHIKFPATQNASGDANTLDDYEEGTYTCNLASPSNCSSLVFGSCTYTKVGRIVMMSLTGSFTVTSANTATTFTFSLPFDQMSNTERSTGIATYANYRVGITTDNTGSNSTVGAICFPSTSIVETGSNTWAATYTYMST